MPPTTLKEINMHGRLSPIKKYIPKLYILR
jgi:hypothetical protein